MATEKDQSEKRTYRSRATNKAHVMTRGQFKEFAAVADPNGSKFYDDGPATPEEAKEGTARLAPRATAASTPVADETNKK